MTLLSVNIDHISTLREARRTNEPDPVTAAAICELAGAHGITVHLRGDRRHIQHRDVKVLRETVKTKLNIEMASTDEMVGIALDVIPDQVTLVPELPGEITTTGGLDCTRNQQPITDAIKRLHSINIAVSLFVDPAEPQIRAALGLGARMIELNTARYSDATLMNKPSKAGAEALDAIRHAAEFAHSRSVQVLAGHGLTYRNVRAIAAIPQIIELNIGHNIIARSALVGLDRAVREMLELLR
ncbi:MAG: pyridoxine 5'-phosphate synthase [Acidobacteria bacterium]|nr:MAG: pyridoxine 5'-phosphate synthase [Acidobacteriota bacterium]